MGKLELSDLGGKWEDALNRRLDCLFHAALTLKSQKVSKTSSCGGFANFSFKGCLGLYLLHQQQEESGSVNRETALDAERADYSTSRVH